MDSLSILIKSILQAPSDAEINKVKLELENKLRNVNINTSGKGIKLLDTKEIDIYVQKMQNQLSRLQIGKGKVFENAGVQEELNKFTQSLELFKNKGAISTKEVGLQFDNLKTKVAQVSGEFKNVNKDGYAFSDMITLAAKKLIIWKVAGDAIFAVIRLLKQIPDIVSKIDESLTEVNKVLDLSTSQMKALAEEATNLGIAYGKTTVEVINSIGSFAKAGLDQETSKQFASLAALLSNVGNISTEVAEKTLIMANAGYQLGNDYKTLNGLISQFNELANRNAIEVDTLAESWQMSASVAKQAKIDIADYNALITVAGSVSQRSGREVGNALRTWFMRLQGVTDGADTLEEDISKVDKVLSDLGIKLRKSPTEFRPAMEVITEIAAKYKELGKAGETVKQSELLESLAGKYRANIVAGVLANFDQVNKALDDQANSFMSAEKENARYMDSIKARTQALQAQWELFASKTLDSSVIKGIVEFGRVLVQVLDSGFVRFIGTTALLTAGIYGLTLAYKKVTASTLAYNIQQNLLMITTNGLKATVKSLWATLSVSPLFWITAAVVAVQGLVWVFDALNVTVEEQKQKIEDAQQAYNKTKTEIQSLNTELETTKQRIDELNAKDKLSIVEDNELEKLQLTNEELKLRLALLKEQAEYDGQQVVGEQSKLYEQKYGKYDISSDRIKQVYSSDTEQLYGGYDYNDKFIVPINAEKEDISSLIAIYKLLTEEKKKALNAGDIKRADGYSEAIETIKESLNETALEFLDFKDAFSSVEYLTPEQRKTLNEITMGLDFIVNDIFPELKDAKFPLPDDTGSFYDYSKNIEKSQEALDNFSKSAKMLSSVWKTINDGEKISADTMISLIQSYPEYTSQILKANESKESGIKLVNILWEIERNRNIDAIEGEKELLEVRLANLQALTKSVPLSQIGATYQEIYKAQKLIDDANLSIKALEGWKPSNFAGSEDKDKTKKSYTPSTEESALKTLYDAQEINLDEYLKRLIALEKSKYSEYSKMSAKELESALRSRNENIAKKASEYLSLSGTIGKLQSDQITLSFSNFESSLEPVNRQLNLLEHNFKLLGEDDVDKKIDNINQQLKLKNQLLDETNKRIVEYNKLLSNARTAEESKLYQDQIDKLTQSSYSLSEAIASDNKSIIDMQSSTVEDAISRMSAIRKAYYQAELDDEEKRHKKVVDNLNKELDEYEKFINGKIKALDELYAKEDYERKLGEFDSEKLKIQAQIDAITLDDSDEGKAQRAKLQEQLDKITQDKSDAVRDHNRQSEKDMYTDLLNIKKDSIKAEQDLEDKKYTANKKSIEDELDDFAIKCKVEQELTSEMTSDIAKKYEEMANRIGGAYDAIIEKVKTFNSIANAKGVIYESGATAKTGFQTIKHEYGMPDEDYYQLLANGQRWAELNKQGYNNNNSAEARALHEENERLRRRYGIPSGVYPKYRDGGEVNFTGLAMLHGSKTDPEYVLKSIDFKMLKETINLAKTFMPKVNIPNLSNLKASNQILIDKIETHVYAANGMNEEKLASLVENQVWNNFSKRLVLGGI